MPNDDRADPGSSESGEELSQPLPSEINVRDTKALIDSDTRMILIDCREPGEHSICQIEGSVLIPMDDLPEQVATLEEYREERIVVYCHHGGRSLQVVNWLRNHGFHAAQNMTGGIDFWSQEIDPDVPRY